MRILVLSDLHLEYGSFVAPNLHNFDAVILAGDIMTGVKAVAWSAHPRTFGGKPVLLVPGNHEFYHAERLQTLNSMRSAAIGTNVHVLERDAVILKGDQGESVKFLGTTLWTDFRLVNGGSEMTPSQRFPQNIDAARSCMPDFGGAIFQHDESSPSGARHFKPEDARHEHLESRRWLLDEFKSTEPSTSIVVITHHAPSKLSIDTRFAGDHLNSCFASDLPRAFFQRPNLWVHGHVHQSFDYRHHNTRIVANPRGYSSRKRATENPQFNPSLVLDVPTNPCT